MQKFVSHVIHIKKYIYNDGHYKFGFKKSIGILVEKYKKRVQITITNMRKQ